MCLLITYIEFLSSHANDLDKKFQGVRKIKLEIVLLASSVPNKVQLARLLGIMLKISNLGISIQGK